VNPFPGLPLWVAIAAFLAAAMVITLAGIRMAETAGRLVDRTGIGEALFGGVLVLGMLQRDHRDIANIGFESALVFVLYLGGTYCSQLRKECASWRIIT
jgi:hypothetical protein